MGYSASAYTYIAIILCSPPLCTIDLLGYQKLMITTYTQFSDFNWAPYDRRFRQQAATMAELE